MPLPVIEAFLFPINTRSKWLVCLLPGMFLFLIPGLNIIFIGHIATWFHKMLLEEEYDLPIWNWQNIKSYFIKGIKITGLFTVFFVSPILVFALLGLPIGIEFISSSNWEQMLTNVLRGAFFSIFFFSMSIFLFCASWFFFPVSLIRFLEGDGWINAFSFREAWNDIRNSIANYITAHIVVFICFAGIFILIWITSSLILLLPEGRYFLLFFNLIVFSFGIIYTMFVGGYLFAETYLSFLYEKLEQ